MGAIHNFTIDCNDPAKMSAFWAQAMEGYTADPSGVLIRSDAQPMMYFQQVPEHKTAKSRVHLELAAHDREAQVERLISLGATKVQDFDQDGRKWTVLQDPEDGEFCIQQGQRETERPRLVELVFDSGRSGRSARFWAEALSGYDIRPYDDDEIAHLKSQGITDVIDDPMVAVDSEGESPYPTVFFQTVPEPKTSKNRIHIDIGAPNVEAEVERLAAIGATVVQANNYPTMRWTVMLDPEGNEFCVCRA